MLHDKIPEVPEHVLRLAGVGPGKLRSEWSLPGFVSVFLPEFPHRPVPGHEHFQVQSKEMFPLLPLCFCSLSSVFTVTSHSFLSWQVLGYIAKGSFGPILKVKDKAKQKMYAVKVSPTCLVDLKKALF